MDTLKMQYDFAQKKLVAQAKKRRAAKEAGTEWGPMHTEERKYWDLRNRMRAVEKKIEERDPR